MSGTCWHSYVSVDIKRRHGGMCIVENAHTWVKGNTPHLDMFLQCVCSIRIYPKFNLFWWGFVLSVNVNSSNWWVPMWHDSHHCLYGKKKEQGWDRYENIAAIPSGHTGCPITVLADIRWKLHASCSVQSLSTSQLHIIGAVIIPFYRWKRGGMKQTSTWPGPCSWQLTQAIWI